MHKDKEDGLHHEPGAFRNRELAAYDHALLDGEMFLQSTRRGRRGAKVFDIYDQYRVLVRNDHTSLVRFPRSERLTRDRLHPQARVSSSPPVSSLGAVFLFGQRPQ
ncbi:hypothetical protein R5R35_000293 [Gryllus longicercus]|uniref:Uncharacterized protein n=1 Tax=Gryllus longicercus TaxID=2509291 RepID=A0AAN9V506_9ORTH